MNNMTSSWYALLLVFGIFIACFSEERAIYLVLMEGEPVSFHRGPHQSREGRRIIDPNSETSKAHVRRLVDSHDHLLQSNLETGSYTKLHSFKYIVNGFAVYTTPFQVNKLKNAPGVKLAERDRGVKLMTTYTPEFLGLPKGIWWEEGEDRGSNFGEGIVIGFVDSGINPNHPSFAYDSSKPFNNNLSHFSGACETGPLFPASSCNGKIVSARFFSAGARAVATLNPSVDFLSPFDAVGHGSHVASTAAGNAGVSVVVNGFFYGLARGIAPRARIAVYKAIYPTVGTLTDVVSAIDQAVLDGVDILTLSVGLDEPPRETFTFLNIFDIVMLFARRAGIFVVQAAGNRGPSPSTVVSYSPWAVGVASSSTDRVYPGSLLLGNGQRISGVGLSGPTFGNGLFLYKLVLAKDAVKSNGTFPRTPEYMEECQHAEAFEPDIVQGSIVICTFSAGFYNRTSTIASIIGTARTLGFMGFILAANPAYGDFIAQPIPFFVSGIMIPDVSNSQAILRYYNENTYKDDRGFIHQFMAKAAIGEGRVASFGSHAPIISRFSSRGPDFTNSINRDPADVLKPDIAAPGQQVWAAWSPISALEPVLRGYNFALLSGTSMATPHIVGIAALIKEKNPSWDPSMIASAMSTTATKYDKNGELIMAEGFDINNLNPSTPFDLGSGLVNPTRAMDPGLVFSSEYGDYINFLCSLPGSSPALIKNATGGLCNHSLSHPADLNLPSVTISKLVGSQLLHRTIKNVGDKPETYICTALPPDGTTVGVNPSWFTIAPQGIQDLNIQINVTKEMGNFNFGEIVLTGSLNHIVKIPLSVFPIIIAS